MRSPHPLSLLQVALNTKDLPGSLRLYSEAFGFVNAGATAIWGEAMRLQGLNPDARGLIWWMVGRQKSFQLELFQHTNPPQAQLSESWRPSDHGWMRFGVAVSAFEETCATLKRWNIKALGPTITTHGLRRVAFKDPFVGIVVEVMEDGEALPGGRRAAERDCEPAVIYAATSVADLAATRRFYEDTLGCALEPLEQLHGLEHEALWDLPGAQRDGFLARLGSRYIEVVSYQEPQGRPKPAQQSITDQGFMNVGIGSRQADEVHALMERVRAEGHRTTQMPGDGAAGFANYILDPGRELEVIFMPETTEGFAGFEPSVPFFGLMA